MTNTICLNLTVTVLAALALVGHASSAEGAEGVDYEAFLARHDMVWDRIPDRWEVAPYTGNGNVGFLFSRRRAKRRT